MSLGMVGGGNVIGDRQSTDHGAAPFWWSFATHPPGLLSAVYDVDLVRLEYNLLGDTIQPVELLFLQVPGSLGERDVLRV
jgi:hypothetical protein